MAGRVVVTGAACSFGCAVAPVYRYWRRCRCGTHEGFACVRHGAETRRLPGMCMTCMGDSVIIRVTDLQVA